MWFSIDTPNNIVPNGNLMVLGVPIRKLIRVNEL